MVLTFFRSSRERGFDQSAPGENQIHLVPDVEYQIATVLHLIGGVLIAKAASVAFFGIESKTKAGAVNPTLADLIQPPYRYFGA